MQSLLFHLKKILIQYNRIIWACARKSQTSRNIFCKSLESRFILQTSGSTGNSKFVCLAEDAIHNVIQTHSKYLNQNKTSVLSILPWTHCFGLVLDLLMCTLHSDMIIRDPRKWQES